MKWFVEKSYEISIYGDIDIDIKNYVKWLGKEIPPTRENLQEYIEKELKFDNNLIVKGSDINLSYDIDSWDSVLFPGAHQYKKILDEAKKLQNEIEAKS